MSLLCGITGLKQSHLGSVERKKRCGRGLAFPAGNRHPPGSIHETLKMQHRSTVFQRDRFETRRSQIVSPTTLKVGLLPKHNYSAGIGRRTVNSLPRRRPALAAVTRPPCHSTKLRTKASPIPRPASPRREHGSVAWRSRRSAQHELRRRTDRSVRTGRRRWPLRTRDTSRRSSTRRLICPT